MLITEVLQALVISTGFVGWGLLGNISGAGAAWTGLGVNIYTSFVIGFYFFKDLSNKPFPTSKGMLLLLIAGVINGIAVCLYTSKVANPENPQVATFMVMVFVFMAIVAPIIDWALRGSVPTSNQTIGFALAAGAIYFLCK